MLTPADFNANFKSTFTFDSEENSPTAENPFADAGDDDFGDFESASPRPSPFDFDGDFDFTQQDDTDEGVDEPVQVEPTSSSVSAALAEAVNTEHVPAGRVELPSKVGSGTIVVPQDEVELGVA